ncbi:MAG: radical SAM protein [Kiritimatiellia bacterium]
MECNKKSPITSVQSVKSVINTGSGMPRRRPAAAERRPNTCRSPLAARSILLIAVNARYSHSSYSVRTLKANLQELEKYCEIYEAEISITPFQLAAHIVEAGPTVAGFSVYLWNIRIIEATARILRKVAPEIKLIAGGPELTPDYKNADLFDLCIIGEGESALREYCNENIEKCRPGTLTRYTQRPVRTPGLQQGTIREKNLLNDSLKTDVESGESLVIKSGPEKIKTLKLPCHLYTDEDIANRVVYVEASRGCPYSCTYCTSAGTGLRLIPLKKLLPELDILWQRGVRRFKFLDRSFTAAGEHALAIMNFFLKRCEPGMCLHFEVYTDILPENIKKMLGRFPQRFLHLECGIQTLNPDVAERIGRSRDIDKTLWNLKFLVDETGADVHADLIFGLPGESEKSFAAGFNKLINICNPPTVQVNLLKALPGTELSGKADSCKLKFNPEPPYELLASDQMDFATLNRIQRFARCWELIHNRDKFNDETVKLMKLSQDVYGTFTRLAEHIYRAEGRMHRIAQARLKALVDEFIKLTQQPNNT